VAGGPLLIGPSVFNYFIICWSYNDSMTAKQKVKYFKSAEDQNDLDQINQFISDPKINATGIASSKFGIILLYEERER
jgi:hypothetical protein